MARSILFLLCERHEARLASQRELIRLTHLPDALGPPCTARRSGGSPCVYASHMLRVQSVGTHTSQIGACANTNAAFYSESDATTQLGTVQRGLLCCPARHGRWAT